MGSRSEPGRSPAWFKVFEGFEVWNLYKVVKFSLVLIVER